MKVWNSTLERHAPLRAKTPIRARSTLRKVNRERHAAMIERCFGGYADIVRMLPCVCCDSSPVDPHHVKSRGAGGDKSDLVPLCRRCHTLGHAMGWTSFQERFQVDLEVEAAELWHTYGEGGMDV